MIHGINDDNAIRYEGAAEILNSMIARNLSAVAMEESKPMPDADRLAELDRERAHLTRERRLLDAADSAALEHIFVDYAPIIKRQIASQQAA